MPDIVADLFATVRAGLGDDELEDRTAAVALEILAEQIWISRADYETLMGILTRAGLRVAE